MSDSLLDFEAVPVDGVPGVFIHETPFDEVLAYADRIQAAGDDHSKYLDAISRLLLASVCKKDGTPAYTEADLPKLVKAGRAKVNKIVKHISKLNGMDSKAVEDEVKN